MTQIDVLRFQMLVKKGTTPYNGEVLF